MANVHIPDDILHNIFSRLPKKSLLRFICVSIHWNRLISDFIKSRSRRMILVPYQQSLVVIDDNVHVKAEDSMVKIPSPFEQQHKYISIVGTFNGIVILSFTNMSLRTHMILYNPLTRASKILMVMDPPTRKNNHYVFGFAYGIEPTDLKIVRLKGVHNYIKNTKVYAYDVFDLHTSSWSKQQNFKQDFSFCCDVGMFLNGYLYWLIMTDNWFSFGILALNIKDMTFSKIIQPRRQLAYQGIVLGSLNGCLCMINKEKSTNPIFDVWVMKEQVGVKNPWLKVCSFTFGSKVNVFHPICILSDGKILLINGSKNQLVIYDTTKDSYKSLNNFASHDEFKEINSVKHFIKLRSIEYEESLVSPSDIGGSNEEGEGDADPTPFPISMLFL